MEKKDLGKKIRIARALYEDKYDIKMTQTKLAEETGITRSQIGDIENGRTFPSLPNMLLIARALKLPINYFCENGFPVTLDSDKVIRKEIPPEFENLDIEYAIVAKEFQDKQIPTEDMKKIMDILSKKKD